LFERIKLFFRNLRPRFAMTNYPSIYLLLIRLPLAHRYLPQRSRKIIGYIAEQQAVSYLEQQGMKLIERNWRCRMGEIDIVLVDHESLVFVEVKSRLLASTSSRSSICRKYLFDSITHQKQKRLRLLAELYLSSYCRGRRPIARIDLVGVLLDEKNLRVMKLEHVRAAV